MSNGCVLIVEDEPLLLEQFADTLAGAGYDVVCATNPFDGYYILEEGAIDLLVVDLRMAGKTSGAALAGEVAQQWPDTAILVISGSAPAEGEVPPGATFLQKPFEASKLISAVNRYLKPDVSA